MKGKMPFQLGTLKSQIAGGPYSRKPSGYVGVKMSAESDLPCKIDIPTIDFETPNVAEFKRGLMKSIMAIASGSKVYVGCMGGIGRTGLYMAGMAKVMSEYRKKMHRPAFDPVLYVRAEYLPDAVETEDQCQFITDLNVDSIVEWWHYTQRVLLPIPGELSDISPRLVHEPSRDHFITFVKTKNREDSGVFVTGDDGKDTEVENITVNRPYAHCAGVTPIYDDHEEIPPDLDPKFWRDPEGYEIRQAQDEGRISPIFRQVLNRIEALEDAVNKQYLDLKKRWWQFWR